MMHRRRLLALLGASLAAAVAPARAQTARTHRVAWLASSDREGGNLFFEAFQQAMRDLGYEVGRNLTLDVRWADYSAERTDQLAAELAALRPTVIVTQGPAARSASRLSPAIPVVFVFSGDPVDAGFVASLARPGRPVTGVSLLALDLAGKRLEILKEILPHAARVAIIANPQHAGEHRELAASKAAAERVGVRISYHPARNSAELDAALTAVAAARAEAAVIFPDALTIRWRDTIGAFALRQRIPTVTGWAPFAESGHLVSYGPNLPAAYRRAAYFVDRVLKGARPADLPVELPTILEMVVNRRTAQALGLVLPPSILARADRVIG